MKRFWVFLLALGIIAVFSGVSSAQVTMKNSGEFYAGGMYLDKTSVRKGVIDEGSSTAFYFQRLRVRTDFTIAPGLTLTTRFDAMERSWGAQRSNVPLATTLAADSAGSVAENENIAFDWAYITYSSPIGVFDVGYMNDGSTGTIFGNSYAPTPRIKYAYVYGPAKIALAYTKVQENSYTRINTAGVADGDNDKYGIQGEYKWKDVKVGLNVNYYRYASTRQPSNFLRKYFLFTPYVFAKFGPVSMQAEMNYATGKQEYELPSLNPDIDLQGISGWVDATADFGMVYVGGSVAYVSGDDGGTLTKNEGFGVNGGRDWNPCLIMWNYERTNWAGNLQGYNGTNQDTAMANGWFFQARAGVKPIAPLDIMASVSYARAEKPNAVLNRDYGFEVDLTATYKITSNLSYMLGAGYLFTGDYYKGTNEFNQIDDDFMVINKLTLTF